MKQIGLFILLAGLGACTVSAQLAYYIDETGRRIYVNADPPNPAPTVVSAPARKAAKKAKPLVVPASIDTVVEETARRHSIDAELVKAIIKVESNGDVRARSPKGASGLMQLMPPTAREMGVTNLLDPAQNVDGGVRYLKSLLTIFDGNLPLSLAAYNAGPGAVERHRGIPPYRETQDYVRKIGDLYGSVANGALHAQATPSPHWGIVAIRDETGKVLYTNLR